MVDTDFALVGDAAFDLVALGLSSLTLPCDDGVPDRLFAAAFDDLGQLQARAYLSHLLLRLLDWSIRRHRADAVEYWLRQATTCCVRREGASGASAGPSAASRSCVTEDPLATQDRVAGAARLVRQ